MVRKPFADCVLHSSLIGELWCPYLENLISSGSLTGFAGSSAALASSAALTAASCLAFFNSSFRSASAVFSICQKDMFTNPSLKTYTSLKSMMNVKLSKGYYGRFSWRSQQCLVAKSEFQVGFPLLWIKHLTFLKTCISMKPPQKKPEMKHTYVVAFRLNCLLLSLLSQQGGYLCWHT